MNTNNTMHAFNSLVARFDFLTLFTMDTASPGDILAWYRLHDVPIVAEEFEEVGRQLGYFNAAQSNHQQRKEKG